MTPRSLSLTHLVRQPRVAVEKPPLLLLLHGIGSNERDLFGLAEYLDERFLVISARAPNTRMPGSYAWFEIAFTQNGIVIDAEQAQRSLQLLTRFIEEVVSEHGADAERVYLAGFSQGAIMSACVALTRPDLVAGAVLMSGRIPPEVVPAMAPPEQLQGLKFLVVHGTLDNTLPIEYGRTSRDLLQTLPVELEYREYQMGHEVNTASLSNVAAWLTNQLDAQTGTRLSTQQ